MSLVGEKDLETISLSLSKAYPLKMYLNQIYLYSLSNEAAVHPPPT